MQLYGRVIEFIVNMIKRVNESERLKQLINDRADFEPYALFSRIDRQRKGSIEYEDLVNFLKDSDISVTPQDQKAMNLFYDYYDKDKDQKLNYKEFLNFILNNNHPLLRSMTTQKETFRLERDEFFDKKLEEMCTKLVLKELEIWLYAEQKKLEIVSDALNMFDLFVDLDINGDGFICVEDIDVFLRYRQVVISKEEISTLITLYDEDKDTKLNWDEFLVMILPSQRSFELDRNLFSNYKNEYNKTYPNIKKASDDLQYDSKCSNFLSETKDFTYQEDDRNSDNRDNLYRITLNIEEIRRELALNSNFDLISAFKYFDRSNKDYVSVEDFIEVLHEFDVDRPESLTLFRIYDTKSAGKLR